MKLLKLIKQITLYGVITVIALNTLTSSLSCSEEDACTALALADLTIPAIADAFYPDGSPIINPATGEPFQSVNELFFNQRTGEYFNNQNPPTLGLQLGDIIEMATSVHNVFAETDCKLGATAQPTSTAPTLNIQGPYFDGVLPLQGMPTPTIPYQDKGFTVTAFELITPGNYNVDFNANSNQLINEHAYSNNLYYGANGSYSKMKNTASFTVNDNEKMRKSTSEIINYSNKNIAPKTLNEMKAMHLYKFIESGGYAKWLSQKLNGVKK